MDLFIALALPTVIGFLLVAVILKNCEGINILEGLFFGYGLGLGLLSLGIFVVGLMGIPFSLISVSTIPVASAAVLLIFAARTKMRFMKAFDLRDVRSTSWLRFICISALAVWIALKISFVVYEGFNRPIFSWDAWVDWSSGAKFFFYKKGLVLDLSSENFFGKGYRRFLGQPLHSPLLQVWISIWLGKFHEIYAKAWAPLYFIALTGIFFFAVKRESSALPALMASLLLAGSPLLTYHATDALSDLPLSYYVFAGAVTLWRYLESGNRRFLFLCGAFFGIGIFTKNEGLVYAIIAFISLFIFNIREKMRGREKIPWPSLAYFVIPLMLVAGPWLIFKAVYGIGFGHGDEFDSMKWEHALHPEIFGIFFREVFSNASNGLIFAFLSVLTILGFRIIITTNLKYIYLIVLMIIPVFLFLYATTFYQEAVTDLTGLHRNVLTFLPVAFFITAVLACRLSSHRGVKSLR